MLPNCCAIVFVLLQRIEKRFHQNLFSPSVLSWLTVIFVAIGSGLCIAVVATRHFSPVLSLQIKSANENSNGEYSVWLQCRMRRWLRAGNHLDKIRPESFAPISAVLVWWILNIYTESIDKRSLLTRSHQIQCACMVNYMPIGWYGVWRTLVENY